MTDIIIDYDIVCTSCKGTGLYKGMAENDRAAVICYKCNGTGKEHIHYEYTRFTERKTRTDVERVYKTAGGYCISNKNIKLKNGKEIFFSKAGVKYEKWLYGQQPKPIKDLHCPLIHYEQGTDIGERIKDTYCTLKIGGSMHECGKKNRAECWIKHEMEFNND